jgi:hypothetical protein
VSAQIDIVTKSQTDLFSNIDKVRVEIPNACYAGLVRFLFRAKSLAQNKLRADKHIVTSRLRNSIFVKTTDKSKIKDQTNYRDNEGRSFNADLQTVRLDDNEAAFGTNVDYAEKIERLDSFIYWGFRHAEDSEFHKEYNKQVNQIKLK